MFNRFVEKTTKSSVTISPSLSVIYGHETFLTPFPGLLCTSKETHSKLHVIKNLLKLILLNVIKIY